MKFGIKTVAAILSAAAMSILLTGCPSSSDSGGGAGLKSTLFGSVKTGSTITASMTDHTGAALTPVSLTYSQDSSGAAGFNNIKSTVANAQFGTGTSAKFAIANGTYNVVMNATTTAPNTSVARGQLSDTISGDATKAYQTQLKSWGITVPAGFTSALLFIYQTDSNGNIDWGDYSKYIDPMNNNIGTNQKNPNVYASSIALGGTAQTVNFNVEMFAGNYRAVVFALPNTGTTPVAPYISSVFTIASSGGTATTDTQTLAPSTKQASVTLMDKTPAAIVGTSIYYYETTNKMLIGVASTNTSGTASIGLPASGVTGVFARTVTGTPRTVYTFADLTNPSVTLQLYDVTGSITPPSGMSLDATETPTVTAMLDSGLGRWASMDTTTVASAVATAATGQYTLTLFGAQSGTTPIKYKLGVANSATGTGPKGYPAVTKTSVSVGNAGSSSQNIQVAQGGMIMGYVHSEANAAVSGSISINGTASDGIIDTIISGSTGNTGITGVFAFEVPAGSYFMGVNSALTQGVGVSSNSLFYKDLTQYVLEGRMTKTSASSIVTALANSAFVWNYWFSSGAITNSTGTYQISATEGTNYFCVQPNWNPATNPNDATYTTSCSMNVAVDKGSVTAARQ